MPDFETVIVKRGTIILALPTVLRFIVYETGNVEDDLIRKRRR
jgi:hypothetical protein